ncbi:MAG: DUF4388 domain-containing protein [Mastigocoleus sp. MO_167.B18]|nr:DUF4388 domain-containing protein [Mastigocoleus sp. MO_167.B18]
MAFTGYLSQFSLPELFRFLEEGYKTGLLTIRKLNSNNSQSKHSQSNYLPSNYSPSTDSSSNNLHPNLITETHYIWLQQGRILAAAESLDNQGLISILSKRGWNKSNLTLKDFEEHSSTKTTMGLYLKSQGIVKAEQLMLLFRAQVTEKISPLFELNNAEFNFEANSSLPLAEMTGLSIPATEATLMGLRNLEEWNQLSAKLPDPTSSILAKTKERPKIRLEYKESQVWKYANGSSSVQKISEELKFPLEKVQQIAFRLIVSNLVEEVFMLKGSNSLGSRDNLGEQLQNHSSNNKVKVFSETDALSKVTETKDTENKVKELQYQQNTQNLSTQNLVNSSYSKLSQTRRQENSSVTSSKLGTELDTVSKTNMSQSFLQNLVGFLQEKIEN